MEHRKHDDFFCGFRKQYGVWESANHRPADLPVHNGKLKRISLDRGEGRIDHSNELRSHSPRPFRVPGPRLIEFGFRLRSDNEPTAHPYFLYNRSRTASQGIAESGSA